MGSAPRLTATESGSVFVLISSDTPNPMELKLDFPIFFPFLFSFSLFYVRMPSHGDAGLFRDARRDSDVFVLKSRTAERHQVGIS